MCGAGVYDCRVGQWFLKYVGCDDEVVVQPERLGAGQVVIMNVGARPDAIHPILPRLTQLHGSRHPCHANCISSPTPRLLRLLARACIENARRQKNVGRSE